MSTLLGESQIALNSDIIAVLQLPLAAQAFELRSLQYLRPNPDYTLITQYRLEEEEYIAGIKGAANISHTATQKMIDACGDSASYATLKGYLAQILKEYSGMLNFSPTTYEDYENAIAIYKNLTDNLWQNALGQLRILD